MSTATIVFERLPGTYRAGSCNIGPAEVARRRSFGQAGLAGSALLALALVSTGASPGARLLVALPVAGSAIGLIQARLGFCAAFGLAGLRNFGPVGSEERVADGAAGRADRLMGLRIVAAGTCVGLAAGAALALLPR